MSAMDGYGGLALVVRALLRRHGHCVRPPPQRAKTVPWSHTITSRQNAQPEDAPRLAECRDKGARLQTLGLGA